MGSIHILKLLKKRRLLAMASSLAFLCFTNSLNAQISEVYIDFTGTYNTYVNTKDFEIDQYRFLPSFQCGMGIYINANKRSKILVELGYGMRSFYKKYPHVSSLYSFPTFTQSVIFAYPVSEKLSLEGGIGLDFYQSFFKENGVFVELGDGKSNVDVLLIAGLNYKPLDQLAFGLQLKYGFVPMFRGRVISNFGELSSSSNHVNILSPEIYLRLFLYNRKSTKFEK